ncbi:hypothetical protein GQ53DRAFT_103295 [Thozetella sp. PMI_491]|nr:hypothetical protein GQ53DRAFT_103295 [Thozetella sp. PMI_491]
MGPRMSRTASRMNITSLTHQGQGAGGALAPRATCLVPPRYRGTPVPQVPLLPTSSVARPARPTHLLVSRTGKQAKAIEPEAGRAGPDRPVALLSYPSLHQGLDLCWVATGPRDGLLGVVVLGAHAPGAFRGGLKGGLCTAEALTGGIIRPAGRATRNDATWRTIRLGWMTPMPPAHDTGPVVADRAP